MLEIIIEELRYVDQGSPCSCIRTANVSEDPVAITQCVITTAVNIRGCLVDSDGGTTDTKLVSRWFRFVFRYRRMALTDIHKLDAALRPNAVVIAVDMKFVRLIVIKF